MPGNILSIKFNEDLDINAFMSLGVVYTPAFGLPSFFDYTEKWVILRDGPNKVTQGVPTTIAGERSAINFMQAFILDYNNTNNFTVTRVGNIVTITALNTNITGYTFDSCFCLENINVPLVYANVEFIYGTVSTLNFTVSDVWFTTENLKKCTHVVVNVETSSQASILMAPASIAQLFPSGINTNPFTFPFVRSSALTLKVKNGLGQEATRIIQTPAILSMLNFFITVNNSPNGATVIIDFVNQYLLVPQYSLDGHTYQSSNIFSGIAAGNYTLYVKDQFGCVKTKTFIVNEVESNRRPYFYISKAMSFRFARRIEWGNSINYKNDENTLSCEVDTTLPYKEIQQFQTSDTIITQFKSNFGTNTATLIKPDGIETDLPVIQKTNNLGIKDKRDALLIDLGNGKTGIYFQSGQTYDYDNNTVNGNYTLNGVLPFWAVLGNYFTLGVLWFQIEEISFNETISAEMIVVNMAYPGNPIAIVSAIYNLFEYEVYEFTTSLQEHLNEDLRVRINCEDEEFDNLELLSETINVQERQSGTLDIHYSNPENTDVYYATGISNRLRIPYSKFGGKVTEDSDTYRTDTNTTLLSAELYETDEILFEPVTKEIMRKICIALSHKDVTINDVGYVKDGDFEVEGPLEKSNLYVVKATMTKRENIYSTLNNNGLSYDPSIEVPGLLGEEDSFIRY